MVLNIPNHGEEYLKAIVSRELQFIEHRFMLLNKNYLHVGHNNFFFSMMDSNTALLYS